MRVPRLQHRRFLVYRYAGEASHAAPVAGFDFEPAGPRLVEAAFGGTGQGVRFLEFLERGCLGVLVRRGAEWAAYAWASPPEGELPAHVPAGGARRDAYWIFHCRTREEYRGRGLYKGALATLIATIEARHADAAPPVFIDADAENDPSRRAIRSCGFVPSGVISQLRFGVPGRWWTLRRSWDAQRRHPRLSDAGPRGGDAQSDSIVAGPVESPPDASVRHDG